jgi:hypothetical protein
MSIADGDIIRERGVSEVPPSRVLGVGLCTIAVADVGRILPVLLGRAEEEDTVLGVSGALV